MGQSKQRSSKTSIQKKLENIINGWAHATGLVPMTEEERRIATERAVICSSCSLNVANICSKSKGGCGCPIVAKTKSFHQENKCPKEKW
jgi:hypothetical protein